MVVIKSEQDLEMLRISGAILAKILRSLQANSREGITTGELDELAGELVKKENALAAFNGYRGFPANICTSVNEEIVHGIPSGRKLKEGDILSLDLGINYQGYFTDAAVTVAIGKIDAPRKKLIEVARTALVYGIKEARENNHLSDISSAIQSHVEKNGFSVVRQFVGHGIGKKLHEDPEIPNFGRPRQGPVLKPGMVLAIEPMVNQGTWESEISENGWTAHTCDGLASAHFEHTVAITKKGAEVLTDFAK